MSASFIPKGLLLMALWATASALAQDSSGVEEALPPAKKKVDWEARLAKASPKAEQPLYLLVHSALDCQFCQRWKGRWGGQGEFETWAKDHPHAHLVIVERLFIDASESADLYPPELRSIFEKKQATNSLHPGVPHFEVVLGSRLVYRSHGLSSWTKSMLPALKQIEARRGQSSTTPDEPGDEAAPAR